MYYQIIEYTENIDERFAVQIQPITPQVTPAFFLLAKAPHEDRMQAAYAEISSTRDPNSGQFFVEFITSSGDAGRIYYLVVR